jgi:hypothetical protein
LEKKNCSTLHQLKNTCPNKYQQNAAAFIVVAKNFETSIKYIAIQFHYFIIGISILSVVAFVSQSKSYFVVK